MKFLIGFFSLALLLANQCQEKPDYTFKIGEPFTLVTDLTYQAEAEALQVGQLEIGEDSRCPRGVTCVWEGQAIVSIVVNNQPLNLTLQAGDPSLAVKTMGDYRFEAQKLEPYPEDGKSIDPTTYVLTLLVQKNP
jgi:hypothetical protein